MATQFRISTFNVRSAASFDGFRSWPFRQKQFAELVSHFDSDFICFQELRSPQLRTVQRVLAAHQLFGTGRSILGWGERTSIAVFSPRWAILETSTRWYGDRPNTPGSRLPQAGFPRTVTCVKVQCRETGRAVVILNTHLDEKSSELRSRSVRQLLEWLPRDVPFVLCGDFNAEPNDPELAGLHEAGLQLAIGSDAPPTAHAFRPSLGGGKLDHIWTSPDMRVIHSEVMTTPPNARLVSDHWPVIADIVLS